MINHYTNIISTLFGKFSLYKFPKSIQKFINNKYVNMFSIDLSEYNGEIEDYKSLNELFIRELKEKKIIDNNDSNIISPCDSLITDAGDYENHTLFQIKGMRYNINDLLTKNANHLGKMQNGSYINFYLSPKDYHRYHSPCDLSVIKMIKIPGKLYPVNLKFLYEKDNLFIENERVILECLSLSGKVVYIVFVGALNVGSITFNSNIPSNGYKRKNEIEIIEYKDDEVSLKKGDEIGYFMMGSTILLISEKDYMNIQVNTSDIVKFGDIVATSSQNSIELLAK